MKGKVKKIALLAGSESTRIVILNQLKALLQDYVEIESYTDSNMSERVDADLYVLSSKYVYDVVRPYIDESCPIIVARRALNLSNIEKVFSLPKGIEVLIVNDVAETAVEVIELLDNMGINHFKMLPYYPGCPTKPKAEIAITPGEGHFAPDFVREIIDIGSRIIDLTTIVEILERLDLLDEKAHYVSAKYMEAIVLLGRQLYQSIDESNKTNEYLLRVLNQVNDGIIAFNHNGIITVFNQKSEELFKLHHSYAIDKSIYNIIKNKDIINFMLAHDDVKDRLFRINDSQVLISKFFVEKLDSIVCTLKDGKELAEMESRLRRSLIDKGHIGKYRFADIIGKSGAISNSIETAKRISKTDLSIFIYGESGTGKELFASAIHNESKRASGPFLAVNFSALPEDLVESELFGYEEGAFTGAKKGGKIGLFEQANKGTIFLDEIGDTSLKIQARLLRVLQEKEIMRVGGTNIIPINVRVIAATNKNLLKMCQEGRFREDLYYRLKKLYLNTPPLRDRKEDIYILINHFLSKNNCSHYTIIDEVREFLYSYNWPGNVRELESTIEYMVAVCESTTITRKHLPQDFLSLGPETAYKVKSYSARQLDEFKFLLSIIHQYNESGRNIGRKMLSELSRNYKYPLSEDQIRKRSDTLMEEGYLSKSRGRGGMEISDKGVSFLQKSANE